jgi:hypothetical protein
LQQRHETSAQSAHVATLGHFPRGKGTEPLNAFPWKYASVTLVQFVTATGIVPINKFVLTLKYCISVQTPMKLGSVPVSLFSKTPKLLSAVNLRSVDGKDPTRLLLPTENIVRLVSKPMSAGMVPCIFCCHEFSPATTKPVQTTEAQVHSLLDNHPALLLHSFPGL